MFVNQLMMFVYFCCSSEREAVLRVPNPDPERELRAGRGGSAVPPAGHLHAALPRGGAKHRGVAPGGIRGCQGTQDSPRGTRESR